MLPKVFLSYGRGDDFDPADPTKPLDPNRFDRQRSWVARLYRDLTAAGFDVWYDRESLPARNLTFHQEIRDAVRACDRMVLVVGPHAVASDYVRQEWQFAWFDAEKIVTPILLRGRSATLHRDDISLLPEELKLIHCEDFRDDTQYAVHLEHLIKSLVTPAPPMGQLIGVPSLPTHFLSRSDRLMPLRDAVRSGLDGPAPLGGTVVQPQMHGISASTKYVSAHGMGGIGKTVLANLLVHDRKVREAFKDGIIWVGLGSLPDLKVLQQKVHRALGGDGLFEDTETGKHKIKELLAHKAVLLVIDDVWRASDLKAFDVLGPSCRALVTSRDASLVQSLGGTQHLVELLTDDESLALLAALVEQPVAELPDTARSVLRHCGRLPLAVSLVGGLVQSGMPWARLLQAFEQHRLEFFEDEHRDASHVSLWKTIELSVQDLDEGKQQRLVELGVFPEDESVPEAAIATLWNHTGQLDDFDTSQLLIKLKQRSLIQVTSDRPADPLSLGDISLHDVIHDYCLRRAERSPGQGRGLHETLLAAYRANSPGGWWTGPHDGYFFTHLREHLIQAGRASELADLLQELPWLEAKNSHGLVFDLTDDYRAAIAVLANDDPRRKILKLLDEALRRDIHFIHEHRADYPQGLFQCLWNHGWWYDCPDAEKYYADEYKPPRAAGPKLCDLLQRWRDDFESRVNPPAWLASLRPAPVHLNSPLLARFSGHEHRVASLALSHDGRRIASGSWDKTVRVWDVASSAEVARLSGHEDVVTSVAFSPDGRRIASGSWDKTVRVRDAASGAELARLSGHKKGVETVAYSPDGGRIVSGSWDQTVRVWDAVSGAELVRLSGHEARVTAVTFSPDGLRIASGSWDKTLRIWNVASGVELVRLSGHEDWVNSVAFCPDGARLASASGDKTVRVWDVASGAEVARLNGHEEAVTSAVFSPDGLRIASGSDDQTVRVWDSTSGAELARFNGHSDGVATVAFYPDGRRIASGSQDQTVRVWDSTRGAEMARLSGHEDLVWSVAFSSDGRQIASGSDDRTVRIWDAASGAELARLSGHEDRVWSVAFSSDGRRIATGSWDQTVKVWDAVSGAELARLSGHEDMVWSVAFSPDGRRIASETPEGTVRVWDAETGECLEVTPDGDVAAIAGDNEMYPFRCMARGLESVVESTSTGQVIVRFPESLNAFATHPSGRRWAGARGIHIYLLQLEGKDLP